MAAPQKLFRCINPDCEAEVREFEAEKPVCPCCKIDAALCPQAIVELEKIHYLVNHAEGKIKTDLGPRMVACKPGLAKMPRHATGLAQCVTCPACKATQLVKDHIDNEVSQHIGFLEKRMAVASGKPVANGEAITKA